MPGAVTAHARLANDREFRQILMTRLLTALVLSFTALPAHALPADPLFQAHETLDIVIRAPFRLITKERSDEEEQTGQIEFAAPDGSRTTAEIKIRARGNFRRDVRVCAFPPLRINFQTNEMQGTVFENQDKLKLVTHCRPRDKQYKQGVLREYLAYRIFNLMTEQSFRVRLLKIQYEYTDASRPGEEAWGFFIEDDDRLGERIGMPRFKTDKTPLRSLDLAHLQLNSVFQFLIANTDFSPISSLEPDDCCHNHKLFGVEGEPLYSIPYDFDMSGFVNAAYATPNSRFGLRSVQQRLYRGRCLNNPQVPNTIQAFQDQRAAIFALIESQQELDKRTRRALERFTQDFYKLIDNPKQVQRRLVDECI